MATKAKAKTRVRVEKWFTPNEAHTIASQFRAQARVIREQASEMRKASSALDGSWEGKAHKKFMEKFNDVPGALDSYAQWLEGRANEIENMQALKYEYEWR